MPESDQPNDLASIRARQDAAKAAGRPYFPSPAECQELGKWWNVPEDEQALLIAGETADHPWQEMIEPRLADAGLYRGLIGQTPTPWDGTISDSTSWGNIVTVTRIGVQWLRLNPDALGRGTVATKTISAIMRKLGWTLTRTRVDGMISAPKVWTHTETIGNETTDIADNVREHTRTEDDDIPF